MQGAIFEPANEPTNVFDKKLFSIDPNFGLNFFAMECPFFVHVRSFDAIFNKMWPIFSVTRKNHQMSIILPKNDFTRKMIDFDTFTKIA